jgi:hypothetical protein
MIELKFLPYAITISGWAMTSDLCRLCMIEAYQMI